MDPQTNTDQAMPMARPGASPATTAVPQAVPASEPPVPQFAPAANPLAPQGGMPVAVQGVPTGLNGSVAPVSAPRAPAPVPGQAAGQQEVGASHNDMIEPEWIVRMKKVISETHGDPYSQVVRMNQLKAEYIQKRYNKTIKIPEA